MKFYFLLAGFALIVGGGALYALPLPGNPKKRIQSAKAVVATGVASLVIGALIPS